MKDEVVKFRHMKGKFAKDVQGDCNKTDVNVITSEAPKAETCISHS